MKHTWIDYAFGVAMVLAIIVLALCILILAKAASA